MTPRTRTLYLIVFATSLLALVGSLIFSNVLGYAPCDLCWYQRICLYPQVVIAAVALARRDIQAVWYGLPLALVGLLVGVYHATIYSLANYANQDIPVQCSVDGTSCTTPYLIFHIPVPFLSQAAILVIVTCYFLLLKETKSPTK